MTEPERISKRSSGLATELLLAGADERPSPAGLARTLAALGVSGAALTSAGVASAAATTAAAGSSAVGASGATATAAGVKAANAVSAVLLAKWVGLGVVGGMGLAGAAAVVSEPAASVEPAPLASVRSAPRPKLGATVATSSSRPALAAEVTSAAAPRPELSRPAAAVELGAASAAALASARTPLPEPLEVGAPLAAEVAVVDKARAALAAGDHARGLAELARYEQQFPEARLLPEVLFLRMEASARSGRQSEAHAAATRLVEGFPKSPHVSRARALLGEAP
jgi:hypothetical protein